jgi:sigma-B regulation protein RsbU (phosphoserine phosphatase)
MTVSAVLSQTAAALALSPVLIVDDSRAQRHLLRRTLAKWGYDVVEAASGEDALDLCEKTQFDVIVSDWMMPGMSGVEFCRALRKRSDRPTYFILLTAQNDTAVLAEGLDSGADDFLSKPFQAVELRARLRAGERVIQTQQALARKNDALETALDDLSNAYDAIERDLRGAAKFQEGLLPKHANRFGPADVSLLFQSSGHVGGDLVGYFPVNDAEAVVYSVDVSGHGVASALMTARVAGYFSDSAPDRNIALAKGKNGYHLRPLPQVCATLNSVLQSDDDTDQYLTMLIAHIKLTTGHVTLCSAGHPSAAHLTRDGQCKFIELWSTPIGLMEDGAYETAELTLTDGDRLVLYSDGITECPNPNGDLLDEDGFAPILQTLGGCRPGTFNTGLLDALVKYHGNAEFPDDVSAAIIHWSPDD